MKFYNIWEEFDTVFIKTRDDLIQIRPEFYFCIRKDDATKNYDYLVGLMGPKKQITRFEDDNGSGWIKVYTSYLEKDRAINAVKAVGIQTFEADLKLWQRYLVDNNLELDVDMSILYFDIETEDLKRGIEPGEERILSIAAVDNTGKEYYFFDLENERKVLLPFIRLIGKYGMLVGWFSEGFDLPAIKGRCKFNEIPFDCWISKWTAKDMGGLDSVRKAGKLRARPEKFNHMDLMQKMKEMHYRDTELIKKVRSFSLNSVSKVFLNEEKVDLGGESVYNLAHRSPELLKKYNLQDVWLLKKLDDKLNLTKQKLIEHGICGARVNDYTSHGRIDPYALRAAKRFGERLPSRPDREIVDADLVRMDEDSEMGRRGVKKKGDYAGGFVFEPEKGLHEDIHVFDFASLYPSIIKTFNISIDSWLGKNAKGIMLPTGEVFSSTRQGIIPRIIDELLKQRNQIRHVEMKKTEKNSPEYWNLHYRQYSFKVLANSMYGIMGASFSRYYRRELAEGITLTGQHLLKLVWKWIEARGHHPIYGDSVTGDVPVYLQNKKTKELEIKPIRELEQTYKDYKVLSQNGWTKIKLFYKHKVNKTGYKIVCRDGITKVTEDHSLLKNRKRVCPRDLKIGDTIDWKKPEQFDKNKFDDFSYAWALGYFTAEGSISKKENIFSISSANKKDIETFCRVLRTLLNDNLISVKTYYRPTETKRSKVFYRVYCRRAIPFFKECYTELYEKRVPAFILNTSNEMKTCFLEGYYDGDGHYTVNHDFDRSSSKSLVLTAGIHYLLNSIGRSTNIIDRQDKFMITRLLVHQNSSDKRIKQPNEIKRITKFKINEEVYDLSTESETFVAGINLVHHNTDSLFVKFTSDYDPKKLGEEIDEFLQKYLTESFNVKDNSLHLEHEASYKRFLLVAKKKYVGVTESRDWKMMGFEAKKRDTLPKAEEWQRHLLNCLLLEDHDVEFYKNWVTERKALVYSGQLKKEELTFQLRLSKEIEDYGGERSYKDKKTGEMKKRKLPMLRHVRVALEIKKKHKSSLEKLNLFSAGSYIPFIVLDAANKKEIHADDFNGEYDKDYYWERCYAPSRRVLEVIYPEVDWTFDEEIKRPRRTRRLSQEQLPL